MILLSGCSAYQLINSEVYNNADLSAYKTFRIVTPDEGKLPPLMTMVDYYNIANAIRTQMVERGFQESSTSNLLINIGLTVQTKIDTEPALPPGYYPYNGFYPYFIYPRSLYWQNYYANAKLITDIYKEGVLTMDMINMKEKQFLYSSSVSTILDSGQGALRNVSEIDQAVQILFSKFPVKPLVAYSKK
ncbi:DUF4136 domain-containing protein [Coprobacter secundus]|uniref:DUF4136 domain-containing protein n=1 Tax=Coprobacter secundus TaxID=1501392 RepID=UPI0022E84017|nr:DUF4136 domain-containing protein [Coprobacter secundus]